MTDFHWHRAKELLAKVQPDTPLGAKLHDVMWHILEHLRATTPNAAGREATPEELAAQRESWARGEAEMSRLEREEGRHTSLVPLAPIRCAECRKPLVGVAGDEPGVNDERQAPIDKALAELRYAAEQQLYWRTQEPLSRQRAIDAVDRAIAAVESLPNYAARELSEKDARIRELSDRVLRAEQARDEAIDQHDRLEAKVAAWEPVVHYVGHASRVALDMVQHRYENIPANLRPGEKA